MADLRATLGSDEWMRRNYRALLSLIPPDWCPLNETTANALGLDLKVRGVNWNGPQQLARVIIYFERVGILVRAGGYFKRGK